MEFRELRGIHDCHERQRNVGVEMAIDGGWVK
jgi:hypothetical protein